MKEQDFYMENDQLSFSLQGGVKDVVVGVKIQETFLLFSWKETEF